MKDYSTISSIGRRLFPRRERWARRSTVVTVLWSTVFALLAGGIIVAIMFSQNSKR